MSCLPRLVRLRRVMMANNTQSFLFAGHDTIAGTVAWVLLALSTDPTRQERLRKEIRLARMKAVDDGREELDHEELLSLEYLDAVVVSFHRLFPSQSDQTLTHSFLRSARDSSTRTGTHRDSSSSRQRRPDTYIDSHPLRNRPFANPLSYPDEERSDNMARGLRRQPQQGRVRSRCERVQTGEMVGRGEED